MHGLYLGKLIAGMFNVHRVRFCYRNQAVREGKKNMKYEKLKFWSEQLFSNKKKDNFCLQNLLHFVSNYVTIMSLYFAETAHKFANTVSLAIYKVYPVSNPTLHLD